MNKHLNPKPIILVSSTVYGIEELLDRLYGLLVSFGYEVWMSHKGTVPVSSEFSALDNCLRAVEQCDCFLGIITSRYGSGIREDGISITHSEMLRARELNKPRWILAHDHVVFTRSLLTDLGFDTREKRSSLLSSDVNRTRPERFDLRVIDIYEDAICNEVDFHQRKGNWAQKYDRDEDALLFASAQFSRYQEAEAFVSENLNRAMVFRKEDSHEK